MWLDPLDVHSMQTSLKAFNKRHKREVEVELTGEVKNGKLKCNIIKV